MSLINPCGQNPASGAAGTSRDRCYCLMAIQVTGASLLPGLGARESCKERCQTVSDLGPRVRWVETAHRASHMIPEGQQGSWSFQAARSQLRSTEPGLWHCSALQSCRNLPLTLKTKESQSDVVASDWLAEGLIIATSRCFVPTEPQMEVKLICFFTGVISYSQGGWSPSLEGSGHKAVHVHSLTKDAGNVSARAGGCRLH